MHTIVSADRQRDQPLGDEHAGDGDAEEDLEAPRGVVDVPGLDVAAAAEVLGRRRLRRVSPNRAPIPLRFSRFSVKRRGQVARFGPTL